jgi:hypothetical protein
MSIGIASLWFVSHLLLARASLGEEHASSDARVHVDFAQGIQYTLALPAEHESVAVEVVVDAGHSTSHYHDPFAQKPDGSWTVGSHIRGSIRLALGAAFANNTNGQVVLYLTTRAKGKTNVWQFSSTGIPEALYATRLLSPQKEWAKDLTLRIPKSGKVTRITSTTRAEILREASTVASNSEAGLALLGVAKEFFDEHRAEIDAEFGPFYRPAEQLGWGIKESGGRTYAVTGSGDLMFVSALLVQVERDAGGHWQPKQIYVDEWFKGE